jgi:hypothetical protein
MSAPVGELASQLGVGAVVALLLLKEVFAYMKFKDSDGPRIMQNILRKIEKQDYEHDGIVKSVEKLTDAIDRQTEVMQNMYFDIRETKRDVEDLMKSKVQ